MKRLAVTLALAALASSCDHYADTVDPAVMAADLADADIGQPPELTPELRAGLEEWLRPRFERDPESATFRWHTKDTPQRDYFQAGWRRTQNLTVIKNTGGGVPAYPLVYAWRAVVLVKARNKHGAMKEQAWSLYMLDGDLIGFGSPNPAPLNQGWTPGDSYSGAETFRGIGDPIPLEELERQGAQALAERVSK